MPAGFQPQRNIAHRFIAYLMGLSVLPLLGLGLASFQISRSALETEAQQHLTQLLTERKRYIDLQTEQIEALITNISGVEAIISGLSAPYNADDDYARLSMQARIGYILNSYVNINGLVSIDVFAANGARYHVGDTLDFGEPRQDVLQSIRKGIADTSRRVYWTGIVGNINMHSRHATVFIAAKELYGFRDQSSEPVYLGLLTVSYDINYLQEQFGTLGSRGLVRIALVDGNGRFVYHSSPELTGRQIDPAFDSKLRGDSGSFILQDRDTGTLVSYTRSEPSGWLVVGFVPLAEIDSYATDISKATALAAMLCLMIVAAAATSVSRRIVAPLRRITRRLIQLRENPELAREHLPVRGEDDVADLTAWFNTFLDSLRERERAERALHTSEARFRTIFEDAGIGMAVLRRDGSLSLVNRSLQDMLGFDASELNGKTLSDLIRPDETHKLEPERLPLSDHDRKHRFEAGFVHKEGRTICVRVTEVLFPETTRNGDYVIATIEDVTAQKQAEAERRGRVAAEAANEAKNRFLAHMSHELRTPLNAILGYAQIMRRDKSLPTIHANGLRILQESGEQLLVLINDILDLSRIEAGKLELYTDTVILEGFLSSIADIVRIKAEEKDLLFGFDAAADLPKAIHTDVRRLRQILLNLLGNAVKFTDSGEVRLTVHPLSINSERVLLRFAVSDTGVGIPADQAAIIFQPFEQIGDIRRRMAGSGLGLAISRQLANMMGSEIYVDSKPGNGSRFWFDIDAEIAQVHEEEPKPNQTIIGYAGARKVVLIVDDIPANRLMVKSLLTSLGFHTLEAVNGREALDILCTRRVDLVLMDIVMPVMNGVEAIRALRQMEELVNMPVIAMSASTSDTDRVRNINIGADAFLPKPLDVSILLQQMGRLLQLEWNFAEEAESPSSEDLEIRSTALPPADVLEALHHMAMVGNMRDIQAWAEQLAAAQPQYATFCRKLCQMAEACHSKAILALATEAVGTQDPEQHKC